MRKSFLGCCVLLALALPIAGLKCHKAYAGDAMTYTTGSQEADIKLAETIASAMQGSPFAHLELASIYCGELCFAPRADTPENDKKRLLERIDTINSYGVKPDYVRAYAHFLLSDTFKGGYQGFRDVLKKQMTEGEVKIAEELADSWRNKRK